MNIQLYNLRLSPGEDLKNFLVEFCQKNDLSAACIVSAVGSLTEAHLRFSGGTQAERVGGPFEVLSLCGTLSKHGIHLHISISDSKGQTIGGHLMAGCTVFTTMEIVILNQPHVNFFRERDSSTKYLELVIK